MTATLALLLICILAFAAICVMLAWMEPSADSLADAAWERQRQRDIEALTRYQAILAEYLDKSDPRLP